MLNKIIEGEKMEGDEKRQELIDKFGSEITQVTSLLDGLVEITAKNERTNSWGLSERIIDVQVIPDQDVCAYLTQTQLRLVSFGYADHRFASCITVMRSGERLCWIEETFKDSQRQEKCDRGTEYAKLKITEVTTDAVTVKAIPANKKYAAREYKIGRD